MAQPALFDHVPDKVIAPGGEARARYGVVVEGIVNELCGLIDLGNSGSHDVVFDAWGHGTYCEVKSLRLKNKCPIYEWRRKKDTLAGVPLVYVIATHQCRDADTLAEVWHRMADTIDNIYVVTGGMINALAQLCPLSEIKSEKKNGYTRPGYRDGYRNIPWKLLTQIKFLDPVERSGQIHGISLNAKIHLQPDLAGWLDLPNVLPQ